MPNGHLRISLSPGHGLGRTRQLQTIEEAKTLLRDYFPQISADGLFLTVSPRDSMTLGDIAAHIKILVAGFRSPLHVVINRQSLPLKERDDTGTS